MEKKFKEVTEMMKGWESMTSEERLRNTLYTACLREQSCQALERKHEWRRRRRNYLR